MGIHGSWYDGENARHEDLSERATAIIYRQGRGLIRVSPESQDLESTKEGSVGEEADEAGRRGTAREALNITTNLYTHGVLSVQHAAKDVVRLGSAQRARLMSARGGTTRVTHWEGHIRISFVLLPISMSALSGYEILDFGRLGLQCRPGCELRVFLSSMVRAERYTMTL